MEIVLKLSPYHTKPCDQVTSGVHMEEKPWWPRGIVTKVVDDKIHTTWGTLSYWWDEDILSLLGGIQKKIIGACGQKK